MQPSAVLTEPARLHDVQHVVMHAAETAQATTSSSSMTPRSYAHAEATTTQETTSSHDSDSPVFHLSSGEVSQYNRPGADNPDFSPISSQEHGSSTSLASPVQERELGAETLNFHQTIHPITRSESPKKEVFPQDLVSGQKRTASGQLKRSSITNIDDLKKEHATTRHSRTSSLLSNSSTGSVMELSQQLRTRLSYAMYKVRTGNAAQSLDELESLASQSPRSSTSAFHSNRYVAESPRTAMVGDWRRKWSSSDGSDVGGQAQPSGTTWSRPKGLAPSPSKQASRRALAPPANIIPGTRRRPTPNGTSNGPPYTAGPYTPHRDLHVSTSSPKRTPSQNAAMEADAVETLLFMASPGNSDYHPTLTGATESNLRSTGLMSSSHPSPLRTQFHHQDKLTSPRRKVGFVDTVPIAKTVDLSVEIRDIDRMLDEPSDDSSDGLDEAISLVSGRASMAARR